MTTPPRCINCLATDIYCQCVRELDREPCCGMCEHVAVSPEVGATQ